MEKLVQGSLAAGIDPAAIWPCMLLVMWTILPKARLWMPGTPAGQIRTGATVLMVNVER